MAVKDWSTVAASNTTLGALGVTDNAQANTIDDMVRELMAQIATQFGKINYKGADLASASTVDLSTATGNYVDITGTTTITALGTVAAGQVFVLQFDGALTLTHNATSLILPGAANITTAAGDIAFVVSEGSGNWRCLHYQRATVRPSALRGHLFGLTLSNNASDATNDVDIAIGEAASEDASNPILMALASGLTKRLDANWAAGTNQGMRYSGASIADTTYHLWLATTATGGAADIYADPSASMATVLGHLQAETGGASYAHIRRIGSIVRASSAIKAFTQTGDEFLWGTPVLDVNATNPGTSAVTRTLTVPIGIIVRAILNAGSAAGASNAGRFYLSSLDQADVAASAGNFNAGSSGSSVAQSYGRIMVKTNTSGQIRSRTADATNTLYIGTHGWLDDRGRLG